MDVPSKDLNVASLTPSLTSWSTKVLLASQSVTYDRIRQYEFEYECEEMRLTVSPVP